MSYAERQRNPKDARLRLGELIERLTELQQKHGAQLPVDVYFGSSSTPAFHVEPIYDNDADGVPGPGSKPTGVTIFGQ